MSYISLASNANQTYVGAQSNDWILTAAGTSNVYVGNAVNYMMISSNLVLSSNAAFCNLTVPATLDLTGATVVGFLNHAFSNASVSNLTVNTLSNLGTAYFGGAVSAPGQTITAATFAGALSGNATTATNAQGLTGSPAITVSGVTSTGDITASGRTVTAQTFTGALNGNAATATTAAACTGNAATATTASNAQGLTGSPAISVSGVTSTGDITASGKTVTAQTFTGDLNGNAATATTAAACSGNAVTASNLSGTPSISTTSTTASNIYSSNIYASNAAFSNLISLNTASFSNINFTGTLTQNGTAFVSGSAGGGGSSGSSTSSNIVCSNLTVMNSLTLGSNTIGFSTGSTNQITAQTWNYMQNYVFASTTSNIPAITSSLMTGVASTHSAYVQSGNVYVFGNNSNGQLGLGNTIAATIPVQVPTISNATNVACGLDFTLVLLSTGQVASMGGNAYGQLGSGNTTDQLTPSLVVGLPSHTTNPVVAISAGYQHSLFQCSNGQVYGFGNGAVGQLGNASYLSPQNTTPVPVTMPFPDALPGSSNAIQLTSGIDAGAFHSSILLNNGTAYTFGQNTFGQLGHSNLATNSSTFLSTPTPIFSGSTYAQIANIACGQYHTLMVNAAGTVFSFGRNDKGQCGTGNTTSPITTPTAVITAPGGANSNAGFATYMAAGLAHSVVIKHDGSTWTAGDNTFGQLGQGIATTQLNTFTRLLMSYAVYTAYSVAAGANTTLLLLNNDITVPQKNRIVAFGQNTLGQVGNAMYAPNGLAASSNVYTPIPIFNNATIYRKQLHVGSSTISSAYIDTDGTLYVWGNNESGQCGDGTTTNRTVPSPLTSFNFMNGARITSVAAGQYHTLALDTSGQVHGFGYNAYGQLGNNTTTNSLIPINISSFGSLSGKTIISIAAGDSHTLALDTSGQVHAFGYNADGQFGNNTTTSSSIPINISTFGSLSGKTIISIAAGQYHTLALDTSGQVHGFGYNADGQLGNNTTTQSQIPINISTFGSLSGKTIISIAAGQYHTLALDTSGQVHAFGYNAQGQLGNNTTTSSSIPINISTFGSLSGKTIISIAAGGGHTLALDTSGQVHAFGNNAQGQLGNNTTTSSSIPINISTFGSLSGKTIISIAAGQYHTLALDTSGQVHGFGYNINGQLGNNTTTNSRIPIPITLTNRSVNPHMFSDGGLGDHKLLKARVANLATLQAVGGNAYGQIGDGSTTNRPNIVTLPNFPANIASCSTGMFHSGVVLTSGQAYVWGRNNAGQCAQNPTTSNVITALSGIVPAITNASSISCGSNCTFFVMSDNTVQAVGDNTGNQLGINTIASTFTPTIVPNLANVSQVATGGGAGMALTATGALYTWGTNTAGHTGQGTITGSTSNPTLVNPVAFNNQRVTNIAMGDGIAAVIAGNNVYTCGLNLEGALGYSNNFGTSTPVSTFTQISDLGSTNFIVDVAQGQRHTVLHLANNTIRTFGKNTNGQLGTISQNNTSSGQWQATAPLISPSLGATAIAASANMTLTERFDLTTGYYGNTSGTAGLRTTLMVGGNSQHSLIVTPLGQVHAFGINDYGQLGNNTTTNSLIPINISSFGSLSGKTIISIAAGGSHTLALDTSGQVHAFGYNADGQLGNNTTTNSSIPINISTFGSLSGKTIISIAAGDSHTLALDTSGQVHAFGYNAQGRLGNNTTTSSSIPINISTFGSLSGKTIISIAAGGGHTLALDTSGQVHAFGYNPFGQLGNNTTTNSLIPINISTFGSLSGKTIISIAAGGNHTIALDTSGQVHAFGYNEYGQLGNNTITNSRIPINISTFGSLSGKTIISIAAGQYHTLALDTSGQVHGFGWTFYGQLGNNTTTSSSIPINISTFGSLSGKTIISIAAGQYHTLALDTSGQVHAFGFNAQGQLGNNTTTVSRIPIVSNFGSLASLSTTAPVSPVTFSPFFVNFTGQHRVFVAGETANSLGQKEGFIVVCDQDDYITAKGDAPFGKFTRGKDAITTNDALPIVSLAKRAYDKRVFGVLSMNPSPLNADNQLTASQQQRLVEVGDVRMHVNAIGEGAIWVSDINGPLESGDLITSSTIPGYGQLQTTDDVFHSYTVAKITCDCDFTTENRRPKLVIQTDENGQNIIDAITGCPVWIQETATIMVDVNTGLPPTHPMDRTSEAQQELVPKTILLTEPKYEMRYLTKEGTQITEQEYNTFKAENANAEVYRAAFVGVTMHCG